MRKQLCGAVGLLCAVGFAPQAALAVKTTINSLDVASVIGATTFYNAGYTGANAIVANIEGGLVWDGHISLVDDTTQLYDSSQVTPTFAQHATWVGGMINGRLPDGYSPDSYILARGIAYNSTLWSGSIALGTTGSQDSFSANEASFALPYVAALINGVGGQKADVVNSSWGSGSGQNGNDFTSIAIDSYAAASGKLIVFAAGNSGSGTNTIGSPASGFNALVVGALTSDSSTPAYGSVADFSSRSPTDMFIPTNAAGSAGSTVADVRARVDITAPGTNLWGAHYNSADLSNVDSYDGGNAASGQLAGTSFAAPITVGGAALVADAGKANFAADVHAIDGRVLKAVLMNSAAKPQGWNNGQHDVGGVITTSQSLDYKSGSGALDLNQAYNQYLSSGGTHNVADAGGIISSGGTVAATGWEFGQVVQNSTANYVIDTPLSAGATLGVTLTWYANETNDFTGDDAGESPLYGSFDNLDLRVYLASLVSGVWTPTTLVAESDSLYNSSEELYFALPTTGDYILQVADSGYLWNFTDDTSTPFGLAWTVPVPEPTALALMMVLGAGLLMRRRRMAA
jgi:subtilisin family serine protease